MGGEKASDKFTNSRNSKVQKNATITLGELLYQSQVTVLRFTLDGIDVWDMSNKLVGLAYL